MDCLTSLSFLLQRKGRESTDLHNPMRTCTNCASKHAGQGQAIPLLSIAIISGMGRRNQKQHNSNVKGGACMQKLTHKHTHTHTHTHRQASGPCALEDGRPPGLL